MICKRCGVRTNRAATKSQLCFGCADDDTDAGAERAKLNITQQWFQQGDVQCQHTPLKVTSMTMRADARLGLNALELDVQLLAQSDVEMKLMHDVIEGRKGLAIVDLQ